MAKLRASLSTLNGSAVMLNIVLGAGLLTLPGLAYGHAGDDAITVWFVCALAAVPLLVAFAIVARRHPDAGGLATVAHSAFGDAGYTLTTFLLLGAVVLGLPSIALTGGYYLAALVGGPAPFYAACLLLFAVGVNTLSVDWTGRVNAAIAAVVLVLLAVTAIVGLVVTGTTWQSAAPPWPPTVSAQSFGTTVMMVFFAFTGWEIAANLSSEFHHPRRDIPIAMALSFLLAVVFYLVLAVIVQAARLSVGLEAPFATLFGETFGVAGTAFVTILAVALVAANLSAAVWAVSRMVWSAATERMLPRHLTQVRDGVPVPAVVATTGTLVLVVGLSAMGFLALPAMLAAAGQNFLIIYGIVTASLVVNGAGVGERVLAVLGVCVVVGLIVLRGSDGLLYPLALAALAAISMRHRRRALPRE